MAEHTTQGLCFFPLPSPTGLSECQVLEDLCRVVLTILEATLRLEIGKPSAEEEEDRVTFQSSSSLQGPPALVGTGQK